MVQIGELAFIVVKTGHDLGVTRSFLLFVLELGNNNLVFMPYLIKYSSNTDQRPHLASLAFFSSQL